MWKLMLLCPCLSWMEEVCVCVCVCVALERKPHKVCAGQNYGGRVPVLSFLLVAYLCMMIRHVHKKVMIKKKDGEALPLDTRDTCMSIRVDVDGVVWVGVILRAGREHKRY